jgi:hypothetical protein
MGSHAGIFSPPIARVIGTCSLVMALDTDARANVQFEANLKLYEISSARILGTALGGEYGEDHLSCWDGCSRRSYKLGLKS